MIDIYFLFNKTTQENIGFSFDPKSITGNVLWRRLKINESDNIRNLRWDGDYSNGKMVKIDEENAIVTEYDLEEKFYDRLFRKFSMEEIVKIILDQLSKTDIPNKTEDTEKLLKFFSKNYDKLNEEIEYFKLSESHDFKSKPDIIEKIGRQFK